MQKFKSLMGGTIGPDIFRNIALITGCLIDEIIDYEIADWLWCLS